MSHRIECAHCHSHGMSNRMLGYKVTWQQEQRQRSKTFMVHRVCYRPFAIEKQREMELEQFVRANGSKNWLFRAFVSPHLFNETRHFRGICAGVRSVWHWLFRKP